MVILIIWGRKKVILIDGGREKVIWAGGRRKVNGDGDQGKVIPALVQSVALCL